MALINRIGVALAAVAIAVASPVSAGVIKIGTGGNASEKAALVTTLTGFGFTVTQTNSFAAGDLVISFPGGGTGPSSGQVMAGVNYIQISDHGSDVIANSWRGISEGTPVNVKVDAAHAITAGLASSWTALGFWRYGTSSQDYVGQATNAALTSMISETMIGGFTRVVAAQQLGAGRAAYIGINVYGSDAGINELKLLCNTIAWAGGAVADGTACSTSPASASAPDGMALLSLGLGLLGVSAWRRKTA